MRKARLGAWLLLFALPCAAQRGGEPELVPRFSPLRKLPVAEPLKPARAEPAEEQPPGYDILPRPSDLMRKPKAASIGAKAERRPWLVLRGRVWFFEGKADTRYAVQVPPSDVSPEGLQVWLGLTEERAARGFMLISSAELAPLSWLSVQGEYGRQPTARGRGASRYWVHSPEADTLTYIPTGAVWHNPRHEDDLVFGQEVKTDAQWMAGNVYFRVVEARIAGQDDDAFRHALDLGFGAHRLKLRQSLSHLERTLSAGKFYAGAPLAPIGGLAATYETLWQGPHFAARDVVKFPAGFSLEGEAFWSPGAMELRGDGYDNLSAGAGGLIAQSPNFRDRARGSAIHLRFAAGWSWGPFTVDGGWQRLYFYSRSGKRRFHQFGGGDVDRDLNYAVTELGGLFAGASVRF